MDVCLFLILKTPADPGCVSILGVLSKANDVVQDFQLVIQTYDPNLQIQTNDFSGKSSKDTCPETSPRKDTPKRPTRGYLLLVVLMLNVLGSTPKNPSQTMFEPTSECQVHRGWSMFHGGMHACRS